MHKAIVIICAIVHCILLISSLPSAAHPPGHTSPELVIAYQPLASPSGLVMEVLRRDQILKQGLAKLGLTLRMQPVNAGMEAIKAIQQGEVTMATLGDMPTLELASTLPIIVCAQLKQNYAVVVGPKGMLPKDLKGKRIGNVFASSGHYAVLKTLHNGNLTEKDVTLVPMTVNQMPEALLKGTIDAFAAWEPTPSLVITRAPNRFAAISRQNTSSYLVATRPFADRYPEAIRLVTASLQRAMTWLKQEANLTKAAHWNSATINSRAPNTPHHRPAELSRIVAADLAAMDYTPRIRPHNRTSGTVPLADEFEFLKMVGRISPDARWETIRESFKHEIVDQVLRNPSRYELKRYRYE